MNDPVPIGVIGLGLIGGSVAKAYLKAGHRVYGYDPDPATRHLAAADGVRTEEDWPQWVDEVSLLFLAAPLSFIAEWLRRLAEVARQPKVVAELSSVKTPLLGALGGLPPHLAPLALHPMAGKERSGYGASEANLFRGARCAVVPVPGRPTPAVVGEVMAVLGMHAVVVEAQAHDQAVAVSSHLPYLVAATLLSVAGSASGPWRALVGPGFLDTTRAGAAPLSLFGPIVAANREAVLPVLEEYRAALERLIEALKAGAPLDPIVSATSVRAGLLQGE
ncbi:MAG: prephenate dehydrogenase/arogenate dehydrogenase family protein [Firmicutes bacterium]|nr:prephenate dehydrogenase/arogenate dehydrogenase family protein [Bacillota bacterium]